MKNMPKGLSVITIAMGLLCVGMVACTAPEEKTIEGPDKVLRLATTTSAVQSGLLDVLLPVFEAKSDLSVQVVAKGTGAALAFAAEGGADVVLVHAREAEDKFITDGYGINRRDVMYNDFVLLGPPDDPAGVRDEADAVKAFQKISERQARFLSRGDNSGTHQRERQLWHLAGGVPHGDWYGEAKSGMLETLKGASTRQAYVLADRATFLFNRDELDLAVLSQGDRRLWNPYGVIAVNPAKVPGANLQAAMQFVEFITAVEGQELIKGYGTLRFGRGLFVPLAIPLQEVWH